MRIRDKIKVGTVFSKKLAGKTFIVTNVDIINAGNTMEVEYVRCGVRSSPLLIVRSMWDEQIENIMVIDY